MLLKMDSSGRSGANLDGLNVRDVVNKVIMEMKNIECHWQ